MNSRIRSRTLKRNVVARTPETEHRFASGGRGRDVASAVAPVSDDPIKPTAATTGASDERTPSFLARTLDVVRLPAVEQAPAPAGERVADQIREHRG
jgi:hypothetical protein